MDWINDAVRLIIDEGVSWADAPGELAKLYPGQTFAREKVRAAVRRSEGYKNKGRGVNVQESLMKSLEGGTTIADLADRLGVTEKIAVAMIEEKKDAGYNVLLEGDTYRISKVMPPSENRVKHTWDGNRIKRFGVMGDTHINSKYTQITHLHTLYDFYAAEGITEVYHAGDIDEGESMRPGHQYECYEQGADDHIAEIVRVYPKRPGITTHFITGNHDHSLIKRAGLDIGYQIAAQREDMIYVGQSSAVIELTDNCTLELRHPWDGTAYALSYKIQKMIEAMSGGEKPNILAVGNYHKADLLPGYRNVHALQSGCLQAQTPFMRGKGISAMMGGWLIEARLNVDGGIECIKSEFMPFYTAIKSDYLNWR